jgi:hypothetical protein
MQVYNHVHASGPHSRYSVLDKAVPGYYIRRAEDGNVEVSAHDLNAGHPTSLHMSNARILCLFSVSIGPQAGGCGQLGAIGGLDDWD